MNIAISSMGSATAVGIFKCIKRCDTNHKVVGLDINEFGYTAGSLLVDKFYKVPLYNDAQFVDILHDIFYRENIDMFIPIHDFEIKEVSRQLERFKEVKIVIPDANIIELFSDKYKATIEMEKLGLICPEIVAATHLGKKILREKTSVGSKGIKVIDEADVNQEVSDDKFLQIYIDGEEYTVDILSDLCGCPLIIIPRRRLEIKSGVATKVKLIYENELIEACKTILENFKLPGLSNVQFIKGKDKKFYFIELNPRFGGMSISSILGSYNYIKDFLNLESNSSCLEENMRHVRWNSIVTRYFEEVVYHE